MVTTDHTGPETMPQDPEVDVWRREFETRLRDRLRSVYDNGRWLTVAEITQASVGAASRLVSMTGRTSDDFVLALAGRHGVGPLDEAIRVFSLDVPEGGDMLEGVRLAQKALIDLPADIQAEVDAWDPDHQARVIQPFTMSDALVAGRPVFGRRRPEWVVLEDKLAILDVWDTAGIIQAPRRVVGLADAEAVSAAHRDLAGPLGTVWAVDNDQGWHGGIAGTHWVPDGAGVEDLRQRLVNHHRRARIMPFLDGVPCSIHGMVIGGEVISFRPSEMLVFREPAAAKLIYGRSANFWDPSHETTAEMRAAAGAVGRELQRRLDFRGVFTLDGVTGSSIAGCEGFVPTEVNMRYGAALPAVLPTAAGDEISLYFTCLAEVAGELRGHEYGIEPVDLQRWVRDVLYRRRTGRVMVLVAEAPAEGEPTVSVLTAESPDPRRGLDAGVGLVVIDDVEAGSAVPDARKVATARWGPSGHRGVVFVELSGDAVPTGPVVAPQALQVLRSLDRHWNLGLPELEPCSPSVRHGPPRRVPRADAGTLTDAMARPDFQTPPGTRDITEPGSGRLRRLVEVFTDEAVTAGFGQIVTPMFEDVGVFVRLGEASDVVAKELYSFKDKGGREVALRPEFTASVCRAFAQYRPLTPWKTWYVGSGFRYDKPQRGRYRQFDQVGAEVIGSHDPDIDTELIALAWRFFRRIGLSDFTLVVNSLGDAGDRPRYQAALTEYLEANRSRLSEQAQKTMVVNPLRVLDSKRPGDAAVAAEAPIMSDYLSPEASVAFDRVLAGLDALGIDYRVEPRLVRGLDYYTRTTFEFLSHSLDAAQNALGGGGRYDGLVEALGGPPEPGVGFALGVDRTLLACDEEGAFPPPADTVAVWVVCTTGDLAGLETVEELRSAGIAADRAYDGRSMKAQMKAANRSGAQIAVIIGSREVEAGTVAIRTLRDESRSGDQQQEIDRRDLIKKVRSLLS